MAGTINKAFLSDCVFVTLPNGNEVAWRINDSPVGGGNLAVFIRWQWDALFTLLAGQELGGMDDWGLLQDFLNTGNMWDQGTPSWRQILNGAEYISTQDGQPHTGVEGCGYKLSDWLVMNDTASCENATDTRWWKGHILPQIVQPFLDKVLTGLVTPPPPTPLPIPSHPPHQVGRIRDMTTLLLAQARRMTGSVVNGHVVVGTGPVPT